ncbi:hypothetical protein ONE63_011261 [Megalurothrips usitatus]|uniref:rRNA-processing protein UTP23 homolog n=1 Tax=Megalurothrips usitatus TaxID=439358 RepID=A0AAV7X653_9NEOP|nr:hypothetical protein ONE63_011261 [Megalurothrips usitatus]
MRITRLKRIQKNLSFYVNNFGFRKPFRVLVDGTVCSAALKDQLDILHQLKIYIGEDISLLTTPCIVLETEKLGKSLFGAMLILKKFPVHPCGHKKPLTGSRCLQSVIGSSNSDRYIFATQDRDLQKSIRSVPAVPLLYFHNKAPTLEQPAEESLKAATKATNAVCGISKYEEAQLAKLKEEELGIKPNTEPASNKKKRKGGPNPLACKKKQKKSNLVPNQSQAAGSGIEKKKRRKRIKIPQHVKEEVQRMKSA